MDRTTLLIVAAALGVSAVVAAAALLFASRAAASASRAAASASRAAASASRAQASAAANTATVDKLNEAVEKNTADSILLAEKLTATSNDFYTSLIADTSQLNLVPGGAPGPEPRATIMSLARPLSGLVSTGIIEAMGVHRLDFTGGSSTTSNIYFRKIGPQFVSTTIPPNRMTGSVRANITLRTGGDILFQIGLYETINGSTAAMKKLVGWDGRLKADVSGRMQSFSFPDVIPSLTEFDNVTSVDGELMIPTFEVVSHAGSTSPNPEFKIEIHSLRFTIITE